ncbi:MAG: DegT/DnrJ/EryC1/StrS family aminotransferase [Lachnospiraceae bacterium]|nr:DegT/DnrJ/EryC1/StrS family aminotransferase [Lachnospiraceae bacterium]
MGSRIAVTRSSMPSFDEYTDEIRDLWESHWLTNAGAKHEKLRELLKEYLGVENIALFTNGHMAIELTLQALGLTEGEVITSPFTFVSTTHAIVRSGLTPVFCDIDPDDFTMNTSKIESLITDKTVAILPIHVYGNICRIEEIQDIANRHGLKVIYDAAHTFGETYKGRGIGSYGDVSCFSFHATKVYNTIEGGAACFKDPSLDKKLAQVRDFGIVDEEIISYVGPNAKMHEFSAAMGICNLRHVDDEIAKRGKVSERYRERLENVPGSRLSPVQKDVKPNHAYFPVVFDEALFGATRDEVFEALGKNGIGARKYFYPIITELDCYKGIYDPSETPEAQRISRRILTLPMYADLSLTDVDRICDIISGCRA